MTKPMLAIGLTLVASNATLGADGVSVRFADRVEILGRTRIRLERAYDRLCSPPLNDPAFVLSDVNFRLRRRFTEYSGDISGRMLGALNAAGPILGRRASIIETLIEGLEAAQRPDGHFGADQNLAQEVNQQRDMPILWGNGRLLLALVERHRVAPDDNLSTMARRLGDYLISVSYTHLTLPTIYSV
mgnify:CR=1 FL=1